MAKAIAGRAYLHRTFTYNPARNPGLGRRNETRTGPPRPFRVLERVLGHFRPRKRLKTMNHKQRIPIGNHPSQPDHDPGYQPDGGDGSDETRQTRTRAAAAADDGGSPMPPTDVGVANRRPEDAPSSDATTTAITGIIQSVCQKMQLTEEQHGELRQCLPVLLCPDSSPLDRGYALLAIIEKQLMPVRGNTVKGGWSLFKLSNSDAGEFVTLARADRTQNGRKHSFTGEDARVSPSRTSKDLPDSPAPSANLKDGVLDAAQRVAPEEKQAPVIAEPKVAAVAVSPVGEKSQGPTPLQIGPAQPATTEPSVAPMEILEKAAPVDTTRPVAEDESEAAVSVGQATAQAMTTDVEVPVSISTVEQRRGSKKGQPAARETSRSLNGGNHDNFTQPAIELPPSVSREPAGADAKTPQHLTGVSGGPTVNGQSKEPQQASRRAANEAKVGTTLTPIDQEQRLLQLETIVENGFTTLWEMGKAMLEIRNTKLYVKRYTTFAEYCEQRWAKHRSRCYQLMDAAEVQQNLSTWVDIAELTEKHCRELVKLKKPADQRTAWKEAAASTDGTVSLVHLKQAVAKLRPPARPLPADKAPATAAPVAGAAEATPDHAVPAETHEEPTTDLPESPPPTAPAPCDSDEFDLDPEWQLAEETLNRLLRRCPRGKRSVLWHRLKDFFERHPDFRPDDETP